MWVPLWVDSVSVSTAQPSPSGRSSLVRPGKNSAICCPAGFVRGVADLRPHHGRVGNDRGGDRDRKVDEFRHERRIDPLSVYVNGKCHELAPNPCRRAARSTAVLPPLSPTTGCRGGPPMAGCRLHLRWMRRAVGARSAAAAFGHGQLRRAAGGRGRSAGRAAAARAQCQLDQRRGDERGRGWPDRDLRVHGRRLSKHLHLHEVPMPDYDRPAGQGQFRCRKRPGRALPPISIAALPSRAAM